MRRDPRYVLDWYAIKFSLAALNANDWIRLRAKRSVAAEFGGDTEAEDVEWRRIAEGQRQARQLALACVRTCRRLDARWWRHPVIAVTRAHQASRARRTALRAYLADSMLPATLVLLAGTYAGTRRAEGREELAELIAALGVADAEPTTFVGYVEALPTIQPRVQYNLACFYATNGEPERAEELLRASLERTPRGQRLGLAERAARDPTLGLLPAHGQSGPALLKALGVDDEQAPPDTG